MQPDTLSSRGSFSALLALLVTKQVMSYSPTPFQMCGGSDALHSQ